MINEPDREDTIDFLEKEIGKADERLRELEEFCKAVIRYAGNTGDDYLSNKAREALEPPR